MKKPKLRELKEAIKAVIKGPYTNMYPFKPHIPHKRFRGMVEFSDENCIGCTACKFVCPSGAIEVKDDIGQDPPERKMVINYDMCNFCGNCTLWCSTKDEDPPGISHTTKFESAYLDRSDRHAVSDSSENELALCESCSDIISTYSHLRWIARKLDTLAYSSPTVYLADLKMLGVVTEDLVEAAKELGRSDRIKILCASCRRKTTLEK
ncbi:MAG: 4Fe-4S dicluster domain-containing protein [Candidatus Omnitrophica bacterium]|nr:4Fe-4S dicluster domain-containing protein [Candidatus Omnitrophota bacterium]